MILGDREIFEAIKRKEIIIEPFDEKRLNSNSYNLRLYNQMYLVEDEVLDMKKPSKVKEIIIPEEGYTLLPGNLYLGRTLEYTRTECYVPLLEGRSSIGRLGIFIHATAGFGDVGFSGYWTLEISVVKPVIIYPEIEICQIYYHEVKGCEKKYCGKYQNNNEIQVSGIYRELTNC
ncbi:MAG: dCTP deaminase [Brevinematales bacterium]|nr:dCTP deaminase [Brevinematales bacterium]